MPFCPLVPEIPVPPWEATLPKLNPATILIVKGYSSTTASTAGQRTTAAIGRDLARTAQGPNVDSDCPATAASPTTITRRCPAVSPDRAVQLERLRHDANQSAAVSPEACRVHLLHLHCRARWG